MLDLTGDVARFSADQVLSLLTTTPRATMCAEEGFDLLDLVAKLRIGRWVGVVTG